MSDPVLFCVIYLSNSHNSLSLPTKISGLPLNDLTLEVLFSKVPYSQFEGLGIGGP